ncbi:hypothetical protein ACJ73_01681 [Blastomyces percursus]|uniref:L-type lectin-like domain-containing protein n=1 Tax=Blastomyces percursus TaxID=1658174 RepID=A0A1J9RH38_9EURO|nr:hypothetical protein ACJ73_01681 [Blastomyces percursus]
MVQSWGITKFLTLVSAFVTVSQADSIVEKASFGLNGRISADKHLIPGWQLSGTGHTPHKLSDRIILTPPYTGNKRGSLWSEQPFDKGEWTVDFEFRSNGADRGGGNLQLWYVKDGLSTVSTSSIYTVGKFDGFALVLDVQGGRGGSIRGFLNDGTTDYTNANVDSLAFGHCDYAYRNLGRLSHIQIQQTRSTFKVSVDGRECFATEKASSLPLFKSSIVFVPSGNTFGITAASAENPDSFEVFKFVLSIPDAAAHGGQGYQHRPYENQQFPNQQRAPNVDKSAIDKRLDDLQNRLRALAGTTERLLTEMHSLSSKVDERHQDTLKKLSPSRDQAGQIEQRMQRIENMIQTVQKDVKNSELKKQLNKLQDSLKSSHSGMIEQLQSTSHHSPKPSLAIGVTSKLPPTTDSFKENPAFLNTLQSVIADHAHEDPEVVSQAQVMAYTSGVNLSTGGQGQKQRRRGAASSNEGSKDSTNSTRRGGWIHIFDKRNPPEFARIAWPEDIFGSLEVDGNGNIEGNYQPSGTYRIITSNGILGLSPFLREKLVQRLRSEENN